LEEIRTRVGAAVPGAKIEIRATEPAAGQLWVAPGATEKAIESARENLRLAQGRYDAGVGTILDLTDAQLSLSTAEADNVTALTDYRVGLATLDRVVGRQ